MSEVAIKAGQVWRGRGGERSRIVVGAVIEIDGRAAVACCSVLGGGADGAVQGETVPFLPLGINALAQSIDGAVIAEDGEVAEGFLEALGAWQADPRGLTVFDVPYEGSLDRLIARQMASIVGVDAADA